MLMCLSDGPNSKDSQKLRVKNKWINACRNIKIEPKERYHGKERF